MRWAAVICLMFVMALAAACGGTENAAGAPGASETVVAVVATTTTSQPTTTTTQQATTTTAAQTLVPNLLGMTEAQAVEALSDVGLQGKFREIESTQLPGHVSGHNPMVGASVPPGSTIDVLISMSTTTTLPPTTTTTESEAAFKASCKKVAYKVLSKNPDGLVGQRFAFKGKVMQITESDGSTFMLVEVTKGSYGYWDDLIAVYYLGSVDVYEDDLVNLWAMCTGSFEYDTMIGGSNSVPGFVALYAEKAK